MEIVFQFSCLQRRKLGTVEGFCDYATTTPLKMCKVFCSMRLSFTEAPEMRLHSKKRKKHQTNCQQTSWLKESLYYVRNYFGVLKVGGGNFRRVENALGGSAEAEAKPSFSEKKEVTAEFQR